MTVTIEVISEPGEFAAIEADWDRLVTENPETADGLDATTGYRWYRALVQTFDVGSTARIVLVRERGRVAALLPLVQMGGRFCKRLAVASELYGGRNGLLIERHDPRLLAALLQGARVAFGPWQSLKLMVVDGSKTAQLLDEAAPMLGFRLITAPGWESPYFPLASSQDEFMTGVSKGLRQTIRTSTNKLKNLGEVHYEDIGPAQDSGTVLQAIFAIERASWKQQAGTAITCRPEQESFYRAFFDSNLNSGLLHGVIMYLGDTPIAYNFGLLKAGFYSCLKHSNRHDHQSLSPNQLLNVVLIERLRANGARVYDYMGTAEPHKLRWSDQTKTYKRTPTWLFGPSLCGVAGHALHRAKSHLRRFKGPPAPDAGEPHTA